jgi:hypothetical protein
MYVQYYILIWKIRGNTILCGLFVVTHCPSLKPDSRWPSNSVNICPGWNRHHWKGQLCDLLALDPRKSSGLCPLLTKYIRQRDVINSSGKVLEGFSEEVMLMFPGGRCRCSWQKNQCSQMSWSHMGKTFNSSTAEPAVGVQVWETVLMLLVGKSER